MLAFHSGNEPVRKRREWILPPRPLKENEDYTGKESIAKARATFLSTRRHCWNIFHIPAFRFHSLQLLCLFQIRSDFETHRNISYSLEGIGANQYPFNVFVVDSNTGLIRVTQLLDREVISTYNVSDTPPSNHQLFTFYLYVDICTTEF